MTDDELRIIVQELRVRRDELVGIVMPLLRKIDRTAGEAVTIEECGKRWDGLWQTERDLVRKHTQCD